MKTLRPPKNQRLPNRPAPAAVLTGADAQGGVAIGFWSPGLFGSTLVEWPGQPGKKPVEALTTRKLGATMWPAGGAAGRSRSGPVLVGNPQCAETAKPSRWNWMGETPPDGEKEIVLRCGKRPSPSHVRESADQRAYSKPFRRRQPHQSGSVEIN